MTPVAPPHVQSIIKVDALTTGATSVILEGMDIPLTKGERF